MPHESSPAIKPSSVEDTRQCAEAATRASSAELARGRSHRHLQIVLILAATVVAWGVIIVLCVLGQPAGAGVVGGVWGATCGLLALWKPGRDS